MGDCLDRPDELHAWVIAVAANIETFASIQRFNCAAARKRVVWAWRFHQRGHPVGPVPHAASPGGFAVNHQIPVDVPTDRELEILRLLDNGRSNKEIAKNLNLSTNTVKWYLKALYTKFDVTRRQECVAVARRGNLLE